MQTTRPSRMLLLETPDSPLVLTLRRTAQENRARFNSWSIGLGAILLATVSFVAGVGVERVWPQGDRPTPYRVELARQRAELIGELRLWTENGYFQAAEYAGDHEPAQWQRVQTWLEDAEQQEKRILQENTVADSGNVVRR